jgi:hypothetical protein
VADGAVAVFRQPSVTDGATGRRGHRRLTRFFSRALAPDNYALVLLLTVVSILVVAAIDLLPFPIPAPILFGGTLCL